MELEKHLIHNPSRLRTFEDARLEIVTHVEAKFGLRTRDSKPSDTGLRGHSNPMDVDAVNSLSSGKGKGSASPRDGCFTCGKQIFNMNAMHAGKQSSAKASHGPRVRAKERVMRTRGNPKESPMEPKVPKARRRVKH